MIKALAITLALLMTTAEVSKPVSIEFSRNETTQLEG